MVRFQSGSFDLSRGKPGVVGNTRRKGNSIRIKKILPFTSLYTTTNLNIPVERKKVCPICHGKGGVEGGLVTCPHCGHTHAPGRNVVHDQLGHACSQQHEKTCVVLLLLLLFLLHRGPSFFSKLYC